jgi:hypothetical protein
MDVLFFKPINIPKNHLQTLKTCLTIEMLYTHLWFILDQWIFKACDFSICSGFFIILWISEFVHLHYIPHQYPRHIFSRELFTLKITTGPAWGGDGGLIPAGGDEVEKGCKRVNMVQILSTHECKWKKDTYFLLKCRKGDRGEW